MLPITDILKGVQKNIVANSPAILTGIGVTGTVSTAILASRASFAASVDILAAEHRLDDPILGAYTMSAKDRAKLVWKHYIPAAATGCMTIAAIVGANHISSKRSAALVTALTISDKAFNEYKEKVVEQIGINKEQKVRDSIAEDRVKTQPISDSTVVVTHDGEAIFYESITCTYFKSDMQTVRKAENDINYQINGDMYASLNDFLEKLKLPRSAVGDDLGWNNGTQMELQFSAIMDDKGEKPCIFIGYRRLPTPNFGDLH